MRPPYQRPYGLNAAWNIPVSGLPVHSEGNSYAQDLIGGASGTNINLNYDNYTFPVYYVQGDEQLYEVSASGISNIRGQLIPWRPEWASASGSDAQVVTINPANGQEINFWQVDVDNANRRLSCTNAYRIGANVDDDGTIGDYRTKENGWRWARGCGIQYLAMLVQPEEVAIGEIRHALSMAVPNPSRTVFAPATKSDGRSAGIVPMGARFFVELPEAEYQDWLTQWPDGPYRRFADIIGTALRRYGFIITDTTGGGLHIHLEATQSAGTLWDDLGLGGINSGGKSLPRDLLDGLISRDPRGAARLRMLVPSDQYGDIPAPDPDPDPLPDPDPDPDPVPDPDPIPDPDPDPAPTDVSSAVKSIVKMLDEANTMLALLKEFPGSTDDAETVRKIGREFAEIANDIEPSGDPRTARDQLQDMRGAYMAVRGLLKDLY